MRGKANGNEAQRLKIYYQLQNNKIHRSLEHDRFHPTTSVSSIKSSVTWELRVRDMFIDMTANDNVKILVMERQMHCITC